MNPQQQNPNPHQIPIQQQPFQQLQYTTYAQVVNVQHHPTQQVMAVGIPVQLPVMPPAPMQMHGPFNPQYQLAMNMAMQQAQIAAIQQHQQLQQYPSQQSPSPGSGAKNLPLKKKLLNIEDSEGNTIVIPPKPEPSRGPSPKDEEHMKTMKAKAMSLHQAVSSQISGVPSSQTSRCESISSEQHEGSIQPMESEDMESVGKNDDHTEGQTDEQSDLDLEELIKNLEELELQETTENNPSEKVYGRLFLMQTRELVKKTGFECVCKQVLIDSAIDRSTMKPKQLTPPTQAKSSPKFQRENKFTDKGSGFKPEWQQGGAQQQTGPGIPSFGQPHPFRPRYHQQHADKSSSGTGGGRSTFSSNTNAKPYGGRHSGDGRHWKAPPSYGGRASYQKQQRAQSPLATHPSAASEGQKSSSQHTVHSAEKPGEHQQPSKEKEPTGPQQEERKRSANAWKPVRRVLAGATDEEQKKEKLRMEIRGILNKVTPSTYDELSTDFCNYKIYEDQALLPKIIDLIFDKAVEEPHFCALYSDLCKKQVKEESEKAGSSHFRTALITKCQQTFDESRASDLKVEELKKKTQVRGVGEKELKALEEEVERVRHKEKKRLLGIIRLISCLFRQGLLHALIIFSCAKELVTRGLKDLGAPGIIIRDEEYVECTVGLLANTGEIYERECKRIKEKEQKEMKEKEEAKCFADRVRVAKTVQKETAGEQSKTLDQMDRVLASLSAAKLKASARIRFMIMDLEETRKNNWKTRGGERGPTTIEEVREQAEKEQQTNLAERFLYEQKKEEEKEKAWQSRARPTGPYGGRPSHGQPQQDRRPFHPQGDRHQPYSGRHSLQQDQQNRRPAMPSTSSTSGAAAVNRLRTDLNKVDQLSVPRFGMKPTGLADTSEKWRKDDGGHEQQGPK